MKQKILVIDYGVGNHQSVARALEFLGYDFLVSSKIKDIKSAPAYILPGVGAFGEAMENLNKLKIIKDLTEQVVAKKKPILGICLGMQILADNSEESKGCKGLGWIPGKVIKFENNLAIRIPHVGWNNIRIIKKNPLFLKTEDNFNFYFDHSYYFSCNEKYVSAKCLYGKEFTAAVQKDNIFGVQFHPEKSQNNGLKLFRCFLNTFLEKITYAK